MLVGRSVPGAIVTPPHPEGAAALDPRCRAPDPPPCFAERWSNGARIVDVTRAGDVLRVGDAAGRTTWSALAHTLATCVGDPFAVPPLGDPAGQRSFDGARWILTLSGQNACHLAGPLRLDATADHAEWRALTVDGIPWDRGGRERLLTPAISP